MVFASQTTFADTTSELTDPANYQVVAMSDRAIAGRRALVLETIQTAELALPAGTHYYRVLVDRGSATREGSFSLMQMGKISSTLLNF